jgi:hypothetical protein
VEFENEWVRVVRAVIPPHEKTALHDHPSPVSVTLTDADLKITASDGKALDDGHTTIIVDLKNAPATPAK